MTFTKLYAIALTALSNKKGAAMIEYALLAALISIVAVGTLGLIGTGVSAKFTQISNAL